MQSNNTNGGNNMGWIGSIISGAWDNINMNAANAKAKRAATTAYNREVEFYKHRFQWAKEDAEKAGINPAVAIGAPGNTPSVAPADTTKANAPDLGTAINSAKANEIAKQNADTNEIVGTADAIKKLEEAGVVDRNTAAKEVEAQAKLWEAQTNERHINTIINRINQMLPGELKGQALDLVLKAQQNKLNENEMKYLNSVGLTKTQMIAIGGKIADLLNSDIFNMLDMKNQRDINNARNQTDREINIERNKTMKETFKPRDYNVEHFNNKGNMTGGTKYHYW